MMGLLYNGDTPLRNAGKGVDELTEQPIKEETVSYKLLLYRKSNGQRWSEMIVFLLGFFSMVPFIELRSTPFIITILLWGVLVMGVTPVVYRLIYRPHYTLTDESLVIQKRGKSSSYHLSQVQPGYNYPNLYIVNGKKIPLLVSEEFIADLETQRELVKRGLKRRGK